MPRLKRERQKEEGREKERSQGNVYGGVRKKREKNKKKAERVNAKLGVFRLGVSADECSFGYPDQTHLCTYSRGVREENKRAFKGS